MSAVTSLLGGADWTALAVDASVKVFLLFVAAALTTRLVRLNSPAVRHRIWCLAFFGALLVPLLSAVTPRLRLPILPPAGSNFVGLANVVSVSPNVVDNETASSRRASEPVDASAALIDPATPHAVMPEVAPTIASLPQAIDRGGDTAPVGTTGAPAPAKWLLTIWAVGFLASCLPVLSGLIRQRMLLAEARRTTDVHGGALLEELCARVKLSRSVRLFELDRDVIPMTWGIFRPLVLLPARGSASSQQRRRMVILHELAHIERLDLPVQLLARFVCAVYWFNPLAWYGLHRLQDECEQACDDCVIHGGERASDYATELVDLAETHYAIRATGAVAMARTCRLENRIRSMFDPDRSHLPLSRRWGVGLLAAATLLVLLTVTVHPVQSYAEADEVTDAKNTGAIDPLVAQLQKPAPELPTTDFLGDPLPEGARFRLGTLRFQQPSAVTEIALSGDEKTVVTVGRQIMAWDTATGLERWRANTSEFDLRLPAAAYGIRALAFAVDGRRFYTPGRPNEIIAWDVSSGRHEVLAIAAENQFPLDAQTRYRAIDVSPDGQMLALGNALGVVVCRTNGEVLHKIANNPVNGPDFEQRDRLRFGGDFSLARFSPDGSALAVVTSDTPEAIRLVESKTGQELRRIALKARLVRLAFSPDGKRLATTERDSAVRLYDVDSGGEIWSHVVQLNNPYENYTSAIAYSPDGKLLAVCVTDYRIRLIDPANGKEIAALKGHVWYPWALAFTADSKMLYSSGWDGSVRRWDVEARQLLPLPKGLHATGITTISPDGRTIAYGDDTGTIHLVDASNGKERRTLKLPGSRFSELTFSPDSRQLAGGGPSGDKVHVTVWDMPGGEIAHHWEWPEGRDPHSSVNSLCFSPIGDRIAAAVFRQSTAYVWDLTTGEKIAQLPHRSVHGLSFSPDGETLATAGWDSTVQFWQASTGKMRSKLDLKSHVGDDGDLRVLTVRYAPQGGYIATAHMDGKVRVWHADEMALRAQFQVEGGFNPAAMSFSPDGLWLATGSPRGAVTVWDPLTGNSVWDVGRHQDSVYSLVFGRDGRTLLSGGDDGVCYLWDLRPPGGRQDTDPAHLWDDLAGEDSQAAYQAMWDLSEMPDRAVSLLAEKLRPIRTVVELDRLGAKKSVEEIDRLKKRLADSEPYVQQAVTVRRALSLLAQLGTSEAIRTLKELAGQDPNGDVARLAAAALYRLGPRRRP